MTSNPVDLVYVDGSSVAKSGARSYAKNRDRMRVADANEVRNTDFTAQFGGIYIASLKATFDVDTSDTTTADDGVKCIVDLAGNRWKTVGYLNAGNNLSELTNLPTARTNLGLGSMAIQGAGAVAITGGAIAAGLTSLADSYFVGAINGVVLANTNDWNPTGLAGATVIYASCPGNYQITGLSGGVEGRIIKIFNAGGNTLTFKTGSTASLAANRFAFTADLTIEPAQSITLRYQSGANVWRTDGDAAPNFTAGHGGTVPASGGGVVNYLRADGWAPVSASALTHREIWLDDIAGADPTGATSSETAINNWLAQAATGVILRFGSGIFTFSTSKTIAAFDRLAIIGAGRDISKLTYTGANTTNDIITFGTNSVTSKNCTIQNFTITSTTSMTGGYALHLKGLSNSIVSRVSMDGQNGSGNLWHGVYFDGVQICRYEDYETYCQRDGASVSGTVGSGPKALMHFKEGWQLGTSATYSVGIRIGGAFGGVYVDAVDCSGAMYSACIVDETLKAESNRELFFWNVDFDAGHTYSLLVLHGAGTAGVYVYSDCNFFSPVRLQTGNTTNHKFTGCEFSPNLGPDGLRVDDTMLVFVDGNFFVNSQSGFGLNITNSGHNVYLGNNLFAGNALGDYSTTNWPYFKSALYSESALTSGSATSLAAATGKNIGSISLSPGEYDIRLSINFLLGATTNVTRLVGSISLVSNTPDSTPGRQTEAVIPSAGIVPGNAGSPGLTLPPHRIRLTATTTVYAVAFAAFTVSTCSAWGAISARKVG